MCGGKYVSEAGTLKYAFKASIIWASQYLRLICI